MSTHKDGGAAFPAPSRVDHGTGVMSGTTTHIPAQRGMSLRDYFGKKLVHTPAGIAIREELMKEEEK